MVESIFLLTLFYSPVPFAASAPHGSHPLSLDKKADFQSFTYQISREAELYHFCNVIWFYGKVGVVSCQPRYNLVKNEVEECSALFYLIFFPGILTAQGFSL